MLNEINTKILLWINSHYNPVMDFIMFWASDRFIWIPFYVLLLVLFAKVYRQKIWMVLISVTLLILLCDQTANLAKDYFQLLRPCHEPTLVNVLHIVNGYCGGAYGYVSSHAANSAGLTVFTLMLLGKNFQWLKFIMITYTLLLCYSRIYLAAHYPLDIIRGVLTGIVFGLLVARFFKVAISRF